MARVRAVLVLGCKGNIDNQGFTYCNGIDNSILDLDSFDDHEYERIVGFFEKACGLFDCPVTNYNKCSNILNMLYKSYKAISPEMLKKIQYYLNVHKRCQPYLILILKEDYYERTEQTGL